jgi:hypothetical protein
MSTLLVQPELNGWKKNPKFPLLCNDSGRIWAIWCIENVMYRTDGLINGKLKTPIENVIAGNTLNDPNDQALLECERKWIEQVTKEYKPRYTDVEGMNIYKHVISQISENGGLKRGCKMFGKSSITSETTAGHKDLTEIRNPMLAQKFMDFNKDGDLVLTNVGKSIKFPTLVQAKVDGVRTLARINNGKVTLESRSGKNYVHLNHIRDELLKVLPQGRFKEPSIILDGELYIHELYRDSKGNPTFDCNETELKSVERFQFISEACKVTRSNPHPFETFIEFWVFDIWDLNSTNEKRWFMVNDIFKNYTGDIIKLVPTRIVNDLNEINVAMSEFVGETSGREGYEFEGLMVRQMSGLYNNKKGYHCPDLLKLKRFMDDEWEIIDAAPCEGSHLGAIKWTLSKDINGKKCTVVAKQMGTVEKSREMYTQFKKNPKKFIGKSINIRYNETTADGIPRFPRATAVVMDKK